MHWQHEHDVARAIPTWPERAETSMASRAFCVFRDFLGSIDTLCPCITCHTLGAEPIPLSSLFSASSSSPCLPQFSAADGHYGMLVDSRLVMALLTWLASSGREWHWCKEKASQGSGDSRHHGITPIGGNPQKGAWVTTSSLWMHAKETPQEPHAQTVHLWSTTSRPRLSQKQ